MNDRNPAASRHVRPFLLGVLILAAVLPAAGLGRNAALRAASWSVPVTVVSTRADLITRTAPPGAVAADRAPATDSDETPVRIVQVAIPKGFRAAGVEPRGVAQIIGEGAAAGERMASLLVHPVKRNAATGELELQDRIQFDVTLRPEAAGEKPLAPLREGRESRRVRTRIAAQVAARAPEADGGARADGAAQLRSLDAFERHDLGPNGGADGDFQILGPSAYPSLEGSLVEYLIITNDEMKPQFQLIADWYIQQGITAAVHTLAEVQAASPHGIDLQERIRMYIRDAYTKWGTVYVLLGGDLAIVPVRLVYNSYERGDFIASDLYYSALDGTWDADGDGIFGERHDGSTGAPGDSIDLFPEVHVGRAAVANSAEATIFVNKLLTYTRDPQVGYQKKALFAAQVLFCEDPCTYPGGIILNGADIVNPAAAYVPAGWDTVKLYEWPNGNENKAAIISAMNAGYNLVTFANHGDPFKMSTGDGQYMTIPDVDALTNNRKFFNLFYLNCQTSEFEAECINEHMLLNPTGGAISVVSPTRFDYPHVGGLFVEEFFRLFYQGGVGEIGALQDLMKIPHAAEAYWDPAILWNYTSYVLLGDPAMTVWQVNPDTLVATGSGTIAVGDTAYAVSVTAHGSPVADALVTVWNRVSGEYGRAYTNAGGLASVPFRARAAGSVKVTATHPSHLADRDSALVTGGSARLRVESLNIDDDLAGLSFGNGDGRIDAGERIELGVVLRNNSGFTAPAGSCTLSVAPGSKLGTDLLVDGLRRRGLLFIGHDRGHAPALPCTLSLGGGPATMPDSWGKPLYVAGGQDDTTATGTGLVNGRAYLWEDDSGWHLRGAGAFASTVLSGTMSTNGSIRALSAWHIEPFDTVKDLGGGQVRFRFALGAADEEDGLDLIVADSSHTSVLSGIASRPSVPPAASTTANFLVEVAGAGRDGERKRLDIKMGSVGRDEVALDVHGPRPVLYVLSTDDSTVSGDHDCIPEPGETVKLWPRFRNEGGGKAVGIQATLHAISGGVVSDSLDLAGDIPGGQLRSGIGGFQMTVTAPSPVVTIKITDTYGATWRDTLALSPPAQVTGLNDGASPSPNPLSIDLTWNPGTEPDLEGYLVYRSASVFGPFTLRSERILPRVSYYQDDQVANDSLYYYVVTAIDSAHCESRRSAVLAARCRPAPHPGWPSTTLNAMWGPPALADIDGDGKLEIVNGCFDGRVYVWNQNGTLRPGWPRTTGGEIWDTPAVGNLDGDPQLEIVIGSNDTKVYAWNYNGTGFTDTSGVFATTNAEVRSGPTFADLNTDGTVEILAGNSAGRLYAWKTNGTGYLPGGPIFASPHGSPIITSPTVADVDGDGRYEIFYGNLAGQVYAYNHDGTAFLVSGANFYTAPGLDSSAFWGSMAIGDIDKNGSYELVASSWNGNVYAWRMNGTLMPGFPKYIAGGAFIPLEDGKRYRLWSSPALGDLDGDGKLEIVVGSRDQRVYALKYDGSIVPGWPYVTGFEVWGGPVIADIDDDGLGEVLVGSLDNAVHAINGNGTRVLGWPIRTGDDVYASPAVGDIDADGDIEVVVGSYDGYVYIWDVRKPWRPLSSPWPQFDHDLHRTGWFDWKYPTQLTDVPGAGTEPPADIPARVTLAQNVPNPLVRATSIRFGLPRETVVRLAVFDVAGRHVRELARGPWGAGWHELRWDGRDEAGREVAAGVYFYRLEADAAPLTRKFIVRR